MKTRKFNRIKKQLRKKIRENKRNYMRKCCTKTQKKTIPAAFLIQFNQNH